MNEEHIDMTGSSNPAADINPPQELSHTDKAAGIFTEPVKTFEAVSKFPLKTSDWLVPVLLLLIIAALARILVMSNEEIYFQSKQKQIQQTQKMFDSMVASGRMSREQADEQMEKARERMDLGRGPVGILIETISILVMGFIVFFIIVVIYFTGVKLLFKGEGTFISALIADGLPAYISMLHIIIASILSLLLGRLINDTSISSLLNMDKSQISGFFLGKVDPFLIWTYSVVSIGLAKMFKSSSMRKYFALVFGIWIIGSFLLWLLGKSVPFLGFLTEM